jgi:hypothetical protein
LGGNSEYDVLFLRSIKGLEVAEVARILGLTPAQVRLRHHRAKQKFYDLLQVYAGRERQGRKGVMDAAEGEGVRIGKGCSQSGETVDSLPRIT